MDFNILKENFGRLNMYYYMIVFLSVLVIINSFIEGLSSTLPQILIAIATALAVGIPLKYIKRKEWKFSKSAVITGLLVGSVLAPGQVWYIPLIASIIAIFSKTIIRISEKQIFNPAAVGIISVQLIFGVATGWWTALPLYLIVILGLLQTWKMKNYYQIFSFIVFTAIIVLLMTKSVQSVSYALMDSTLLFFMFFMFTEPKTSPYTRNGKVAYALIVVSLVWFTLFVLGGFLGHIDPYLTALLLGNLTVPLLRKFVK